MFVIWRRIIYSVVRLSEDLLESRVGEQLLYYGFGM